MYSWVNLTNVPSPTHNVTFAWLTPQKTLYFNASATIPDPGAGKFWAYYIIYDDIFVSGYVPASMLGSWEVDIYFNGAKLWSQTFTLNATVPPRIQIADSAVSPNFNSTSHYPVNRTLNITANATDVYSWVNFTSVPAPSHNVTWVWLTPQKSEYFASSGIIPGPGSGRIWSQYSVWDDVFVSGHQAAQLPGVWEVDIYVDGSKVLIQTFIIQ